jgi:pimeloyl-ACP methyl ester carboxylesterase
MRNDSSPHLRLVRDAEAPSLQFRTIHGYRRAFRVAGSGPALLLIHGVGANSTTWEPVHAKLAQRFTVIAPDLLGHGESDKPRADYSLAAFANGMRDLLAALDIDRVTVVGHSFGGGVAMQFAYQYPQLVERIVLVSSGGVGKDVSLALRLAALPMGSDALAMLRVPGALPAVRLFGRAVGTVLGSTKFGRDVADIGDLLGNLLEPGALSAFARTLRSVVDGSGQFVTMLDRSYLMQSMPVQLIWGEEDLVIPVEHARMAHEAMPDSRLEIFEKSGHMPFRDHPDRFVEVVERFLDSTRPANYDQDHLRSQLQAGLPQDASTASVAAAPTAIDTRALAEARDAAVESPVPYAVSAP